ncbi:MAG TPA: fimbria/pilus outer membrane usher protein [Usitatibacter sp.]|jgi:outer membrane usher protein|nr:fimbria/pilus outer membrane usher protein [Usitatibacter sp.]
MPLEVVVNGATVGTWVLVHRGGILYAPAEAFEEWRLEVQADAPSLRFKGQKYLALTAIPGFQAKVDESTQTVQLLFSPKAFAVMRMSQELPEHVTVSPAVPSLFLNYDVSYQHSQVKDAAGTRDLGLLSELGLSGAWGVLTTSSTVRNLAGYRLDQEPRQWLRLETRLTRDFPERRTTLLVGDTTTRPGMWGREVYFGGVRYGTNFALTPGFVSQPLPVISGLSAAPSTVELYVNDVLRSVSKVPTGPFVIDNFPVLSGSGEARLVVRDLLGRDTVITQPFFITNTMLSAGLDDWSVEAGRVRHDLGLASDDYGPAFASGTWRRGMSNTLTLEGRAEGSRRLQLVGAGMLTMLPWEVLARAALVGSHTDNLGDGGHWLIGLEHQGAYGGINVEVSHSSPAFRETGQLDTVSPIRTQVASTLNYSSASWGTFGVGYASIDRYDRTRITTVSANYARRIGERSTLSLTASHAIAGGTGSAFGLAFIMPLDLSRVTSFTANSRSDSQDAYASAVQNPGIDSGVGWRALAGEERNRARVEGGLYYQGQYGYVSSDASASSSTQTVRVGAVGAVVFAQNHLFATRRLDESFAIAEVPGYPNVGIGIGSNVLARTNADGVALVPRLIPYTPNSIRIDPKELPISAEVESIEQTVVPAWRSGVKVTFPVRSGRGALLSIVLDDGNPAPAGAIVRLAGDKEEFYVARRGEAFVTGLEAASRVSLEWKSGRCALEVRLPPEKPDQIARVGPIACHGVAR